MVIIVIFNQKKKFHQDKGLYLVQIKMFPDKDILTSPKKTFNVGLHKVEKS